MKNLIWVIIFIISAIAVACTEGKEKKRSTSTQQQPQIEDSVVEIASIAMKGRIIEDTVIGH